MRETERPRPQLIRPDPTHQHTLSYVPTHQITHTHTHRRRDPTLTEKPGSYVLDFLLLHCEQRFRQEPGGIEFNLPISAWLRLFDRIGFDVIDYREIQAPVAATGQRGAVTAEWAKRFPSEQVWRLMKRRLP